MDLAKTITEELFTSGTGEKANRLVMEFDKHIDGCGWGKPAVNSIIADAINESIALSNLRERLIIALAGNSGLFKRAYK
jgi:hypothetical protein